MSQGLIDCLTRPRAQTVPPGATWAADNGCFGKGDYPGDVTWLRWLARKAETIADTCRFVVAPDVVCDAAATEARSLPLMPKVRALGLPVAFVAQNGLEKRRVPWDEFDCLFIGGDTDWKLGVAARRLAGEAKDRGKWVHMGRVNSLQRLRTAAGMGCDSVDGTYTAFAPDINLTRLLGWLAEHEEQPSLF